MFGHRRHRRRTQLLVDRELVGRDVQKTLAHLVKCSNCQEELAFLSAARRALRRIGDVRADLDGQTLGRPPVG